MLEFFLPPIEKLFLYCLSIFSIQSIHYLMTRYFSIGLIVLLFACKNRSPKKPIEIENKSEELLAAKPTISFTFDDGITSELAGFEFEEWNNMILSHLDTNNLKSIFFVTGRNKTDDKGQFLLDSWNSNGHKIANHTFNHLNFNADKNDAVLFEIELNKTHEIISKLSNSVKLFRFPYLKEGAKKLKVDSLRNILSTHGYRNGYVTIDASDWYINQRLIKRINEVGFENTDIEKFKKFYKQHLVDKANYYESLSYELNDRHISHTLLLHHNLTSALFLGDLIKEFKKMRWNVIDAEEAYKDNIFTKQPNSEYAGESLIWSLAKQSGKYEGLLRYPPEDSKYEKAEMDARGL